MKWFMVFLALIGLVLGAASARAEPIDDPTLDITAMGEPVEGDSWSQPFVIKRTAADNPPAGDMNKWFDHIQGKMTSGQWDQAPPAGSHVAISDFDEYPTGTPHTAYDAKEESWGQDGNNAQYFLASTSVATPEPPNGTEYGLQFILYFAGSKTDWSSSNQLKLSLQVYQDDKRKKNYDFWFDGSTWDKRSWTWSQEDLIPVPTSAVPEPMSLAFVGSALCGVVGFGLTKRRKEGRN